MSIGIRLACVVITTVGTASLPLHLSGQDSSATGHFHIGLTVHDWGVSFGNARRVNGVRVNVQDADLYRVNGLNITLWKPREPLTGTVNGVQAGLVPGARRVTGLAVGLGGVVTEDRARGILIGGLGAVSNRDLDGVVIGGLGTVANRDISGIAIGGLGTVANRQITGIALGGLGTVANRDLVGVAIGGLGTVANRDVVGAAAGGLGLVANGTIRGVGLGGLAVVANGSIDGVALGGLAVVANGRLTGLGLGGLTVVANEAIHGVAIAGGGVDTHELNGLAISPYNRVRGFQRGLTIGVYNSAAELHGLQLGLLNRAKNNRAPFKILPVLNVHH